MSARPWDYADRAAKRIADVGADAAEAMGVRVTAGPRRAARRKYAAIIREEVRAEAARALAAFARKHVTVDANH